MTKKENNQTKLKYPAYKGSDHKLFVSIPFPSSISPFEESFNI